MEYVVWLFILSEIELRDWVIVIYDYCKKLNSLKHLVRATVAELNN